jgi:glycosyltransferase involved in cell wall biosynthesis
VRVAYVCPQYGPGNNVVVRALDARDDVEMHCVVAIEGDPNVLPPEVAATVLPSRQLRQRRTWTTIAGLGQALDDVQPDIVHVHGEPWSLSAVQAVRARKRSVVVHGAETFYGQGGMVEAQLRRRVARYVLARVGGFVGWAEIAVDAARAGGLPAAVPACIAPAIMPDVATYAAARARREATRRSYGVDGATVVTYVGRLVPEKGLDWLRRAFDDLPDGDRRLWIIGDGPLREPLATWASTRDGIQLFGRRDAAGVADLLAASDRVVVPSLTTDRWEEQFGRVAVEACLAGTRAIVSTSGALPEVVGSVGDVVAENDTAALAAAIAGARPRELEESGSDGSGSDVSRSAAALDWATRHFHPDVVAGHLVELWSEVIARRELADGS